VRIGSDRGILGIGEAESARSAGLRGRGFESPHALLAGSQPFREAFRTEIELGPISQGPVQEVVAQLEICCSHAALESAEPGNALHSVKMRFVHVLQIKGLILGITAASASPLEECR
jgi:hypothetical protein